jgi:hypothetical protein
MQKVLDAIETTKKLFDSNRLLPPIDANEIRRVKTYSGENKVYTVDAAICAIKARHYHEYIFHVSKGLIHLVHRRFEIEELELGRILRTGLGSIDSNFRNVHRSDGLSDNWIAGLCEPYAEIICCAILLEGWKISQVRFSERIKGSIAARGLLVGLKSDSSSIEGIPIVFYNAQ